MIVEVTRLLDRWFKGSMGVDYQLSLLQRDTPEGSQDPMPVTPVIYNDIEDECVASDIDPTEVPALVIFADSGAEIPAAQKTSRLITKTLVLVAAYVTRDANPVDASRDGGYVLRAVLKSLADFNHQQNSAAYRSLNGIKILSVESATIERVAADVGRSRLWGFVIAELSVIEG